MRTDRRALLALVALGGLALPARAKEAVRTVGNLSNGADTKWLARLLSPLGYEEGRNLRFEWGLTDTDPDRLAAQAAKLVAARPDVLVAFGISNVRALARHTRTIPIVCGETADPVGLGIARTLARPGGNVTGLSAGVPEVAPILVGLMRAVRPALRRIVTVVRSIPAGGEREGWGVVLRSLEVAAREAALDWDITPVESLAGLERTLPGLPREATILYLVSLPQDVAGPQVIAAANRHRLATVSAASQLVRAGALMHYSIYHANPQARVAALVDKLLRGANPAETPFELPDRTNFTVNRATARAIGIDLPAHVLARATEIID